MGAQGSGLRARGDEFSSLARLYCGLGFRAILGQLRNHFSSLVLIIPKKHLYIIIFARGLSSVWLWSSGQGFRVLVFRAQGSERAGEMPSSGVRFLNTWARQEAAWNDSDFCSSFRGCWGLGFSLPINRAIAKLVFHNSSEMFLQARV